MDENETVPPRCCICWRQRKNKDWSFDRCEGYLFTSYTFRPIHQLVMRKKGKNCKTENWNASCMVPNRRQMVQLIIMLQEWNHEINRINWNYYQSHSQSKTIVIGERMRGVELNYSLSMWMWIKTSLWSRKWKKKSSPLFDRPIKKDYAKNAWFHRELFE